MNEVTFVDLLDRTDAYIRANEALVSAIRSAFFASAQARYATGYRQVRECLMPPFRALRSHLQVLHRLGSCRNP